MEISESGKNALFEKYRKKIEREFDPEKYQQTPDIPYSRVYEMFKKEQIGSAHSLYEKLCNNSEKILRLKLRSEDREKLVVPIKLAHINITPEGAYAFAMLATIAVLFVGFGVGMALASLNLIIAGAVSAIAAFFYLPRVPKSMFLSWRAKSSDQLVLSVLYMIIYMEHTPNLEQAVWFAAKHLPPPLSLDFIKILWDIETKKYSSAQESLEEYIDIWKGWDDSFIESVRLVESSLMQPDKKQQLSTLAKAEEVLLEGTQDRMMMFAHNLQSPVETLHMLGIVLPIMGLVMLPMMTAFMGDSVRPEYLIIMYNIFLPIVVFALARSVLATRPAGVNPTDIYAHLNLKRTKPTVNFYGIKLPAMPISLLIFLAPTIIASTYMLSKYMSAAPEAASDVLHSLDFFMSSVAIVASAGMAIASYYFFKINEVYEKKRQLSQIEGEFSSAIFQLGSRIKQGLPAEIAIAQSVDAMPKAEISNLFRAIDYNIRQQGMTLNQAIFDKKSGAIVYYPSAIIKAVMQTLVESARKSPKIAGDSLIIVSQFLQNVHRVTERLKDLMADTISSIAMQIKMFAPAISGIVVGLSVLTTNILRTLGDRLLGLETGTEGASFGTGLLNIFQISAIMPTFVFQVIVGAYLIEIVVIMTYLLSGLVNGQDNIEFEHALAINLFMSVVFYTIITVVCTMLFLGLVSGLAEVV